MKKKKEKFPVLDNNNAFPVEDEINEISEQNSETNDVRSLTFPLNSLFSL